MSEKKLYKNLIIYLIILGSILRIVMFWISPPNNAYDDHLEVISIYAQDYNRPAPFKCWECYQPPLYYFIGAIVYDAAYFLGFNNNICWKIVQGINPLLSIITLFLAYKILILFNIRKQLVALVISFLVVLPRDIFTAVMISNDYLLVFFSVLSFYLFLKTIESIRKSEFITRWFGALIIICLLGGFVKQHGLLLNIFPGIILIILLKKGYRKILYIYIPIIILSALISLSEEYWKFNKTGEFLVSNQHYFDYAKDQYPGSIYKVEFFSFRIFKLYKEPFISENTSSSLVTELFARTFFDYEWRFITPTIPWANTLGRISYTVGFIWLLFFILLFLSILKKIRKYSFFRNLYSFSSFITPLILAIFFMAVPLLQTLRYPYFSSMKSMFMLPGVIIILLIMGRLSKYSTITLKFWSYLVLLNVLYGILLVSSIYFYFSKSINHLHGPLWSIPYLNI